MQNNFRAFLHESLKEATKIALKKFGKVSGSVKAGDHNQVLTEADTAIGRKIISIIERRYPNHNIIDEEAGAIDKKSDYTWVIDPIDGTSNFAVGVPTFGIMLGLLYKDRPILGGVSLPAFSEIIIAEKGKGAVCNGKKIRVTSEKNLLSTLVAHIIDGHPDNQSITREEIGVLGEIVLNIRNLRASGSVFDIIMVAKGKYGGFLCRSSKVWDNVAPQIIVEEAGGIYTDFFGKPVDYTSAITRVEENYTVCAAPLQLHKQLQEIIRRTQRAVE
jgi:myo-inositol-1(or 4)-monophosphatase